MLLRSINLYRQQEFPDCHYDNKYILLKRNSHFKEVLKPQITMKLSRGLNTILT